MLAAHQAKRQRKSPALLCSWLCPLGLPPSPAYQSHRFGGFHAAFFSYSNPKPHCEPRYYGPGGSVPEHVHPPSRSVSVDSHGGNGGAGVHQARDPMPALLRTDHSLLAESRAFAASPVTIYRSFLLGRQARQPSTVWCDSLLSYTHVSCHRILQPDLDDRLTQRASSHQRTAHVRQAVKAQLPAPGVDFCVRLRTRVLQSQKH